MKKVVTFFVCLGVTGLLYASGDREQNSWRLSQEEVWRLGVDLTYQGYSQEYINAVQLYYLVGAEKAVAWSKGASDRDLSRLEAIRLAAQANMIALEKREVARVKSRE